MPDQNDLVALLVVTGGLVVDLEHQRTGRIQHKQVAVFRARGHRFGHSVGRKDHRLSRLRDFVELFHKNGAFGPQAFHHESIMHDLVADIDRRAILLQSEFDDLDRTVDTCTKAARRGEQDL